MNEEKRITAWLNPHSITTGKYGTVTNEIWLQKEQIRVEKDKPCQILTNNVGYKALFYK